MLLDKSPTVGSELPTARVVCADVCTNPPLAARAATIVMDPPWYPDLVRTWIRFALFNLTVGGDLWTTLWPELTRAGAAYERDELLLDLAKVGTVTVTRDMVEYEVPGFERRILLDHGVPEIGQWRSGDLVRVRVERADAFPEPVPLRPVRHWHRFIVGTRQIALLRRAPDGRRAELLPLSNGKRVMNSLSRRDPSRDEIEIWSSGGRVARLQGWEAFAAALRQNEHAETSGQLEVARARDLLEADDFIGSTAFGISRSVREWLDLEWKDVSKVEVDDERI